MSDTNPTPVPLPAPAKASSGGATVSNAPISAMAASNSKAAVQAYLDKCRAFGELEGKGKASRLGWFLDTAERSYNKDIERDQIGPGYDEFLKSKKLADPTAKRVGKENLGKDRAVRVSECSTICFVATLPSIDGMKAINLVMKVIKDNPQLDGETTSLLLAGARAQKNSPTVPLTKDELLDAMTSKTERAEKALADYLHAVAQRIDWIATRAKEGGKGFGWTPHMRSAFSSINAEVLAQGGTTAQKKAAAYIAKKAASKKKI